MVLSGCAGVDRRVDVQQLQNQADQGDPTAQFKLGAAYDYGTGVTRDLSQAVHWYRKAAEQGNTHAQNSLGSMYHNGEGVTQDLDQAVQWYRKASDQDYAEGHTNYGYMLDHGLGVDQDKQKAIELYQRGAELGSLNAMLNLGVSYWEGEGTTKDLVEAYKWLDLARFYTQRSPNMRLKWRVRGILDQVKQQMTKDQIRAADVLVREWDQAHRQ